MDTIIGRNNLLGFSLSFGAVSPAFPGSYSVKSMEHQGMSQTWAFGSLTFSCLLCCCPVLSISMALERMGLVFSDGLHRAEVEFLIPSIDMQSTLSPSNSNPCEGSLVCSAPFNRLPRGFSDPGILESFPLPFSSGTSSLEATIFERGL